MIEIEDRHRELLRTLAGAEVQFVLVGGVALQLRGFSGRHSRRGYHDRDR